ARAASASAGQLLSESGTAAGGAPAGPLRWVRYVAPHPPGATASDPDLVRVVPVRSATGRFGELVLVRAPADRAFGATDNRPRSAAGGQLAAAAERARLQREATEAEVLRRTDELKSALINAVSHDVRTPLASIMTAAGSLKRDDVAWTKEERREFAEDIEQET